MANKLLNVRMDQEMIEDLKKVCGELEISVTDAIKLFSNKLITERTLPTEEEKEKKTIEEIMNEYHETFGKNEEYEKMFNDINEISYNYYQKLKSFITPSNACKNSYEEIIKKFKEEFGEEIKDKILDKIIEFCKFYYDDIRASYFEMWEEKNKLKNDKYIDVMENLKNANPDLYKELLNKYSYNVDYWDLHSLNCKNYNDAKKKLEEFLTPEEIKEYYAFNLELDNCKTEEEKEKLIENLKKDEKKFEILNSAFDKFEEYENKKNSQKQIESNNNSEEK